MAKQLISSGYVAARGGPKAEHSAEGRSFLKFGFGFGGRSFLAFWPKVRAEGFKIHGWKLRSKFESFFLENFLKNNFSFKIF